MTDPLDKQLVEVALSGGGRRKADIEEAKLAGVRTRRALDEDSLDDDEDLLEDDEVAPPDSLDEDATDGAEEDVVAAPRIVGDAPAKITPGAVEEPTQEELDAISADMIGIDDPVRMYLKEIGKVALAGDTVAVKTQAAPSWHVGGILSVRSAS